MIIPYLPLVLVTALSSIAATTIPNFSVFESVPDTGPWLRGDKATSSTILNLQIALYRSRASEFEQHVVDISTPGHELYGNHLTREQVRDFVRPSQHSIETVLRWMEENDVVSDACKLTEAADRINFAVTVGKAESLFNTDFYTYTNEGQSIVRAQQYSLPDTLREHVVTVMPIVRFPEITPHVNMILEAHNIGSAPPSLEYDPEFCNHTITPACLQGLYQMNNFTAPQWPGTMIGVSGYLNQTPLIDDLHDFIAAYASYAPQVFPTLLVTDNSTIHDANTVGPHDTQEASLDMQYTSSMAPGISLTWYSTYRLAPSNPDLDSPAVGYTLNEPYHVQLLYFLDLPDDQLPSVLSTSYGENEQTVPPSYRNITCNLFAQLTARGVSIIFSSGDSGPGSSCTSNDASKRALFNPIFPATCPYVTSVGGTMGVEPEVAAKFSSGGFSENFDRPFWQEDVIPEYLNILGDRWKGLYQPHGRGFPDVAVQSSNFITRDHHRNAWVSGTSAAAPVFAGMIANLNAVRLNQGLPRLGWLNPWLYIEAKEAFTDIVDGGSTGCTGRSIFSGRNATYIPYASWNATKGWDPVTGLGTPIWPKLLEIATRRNSSQVPYTSAHPAAKEQTPPTKTLTTSVSTGTGSLRSGNRTDKVGTFYRGDGPWNSMHPRPRPSARPDTGLPYHRNGTWPIIPPKVKK